MARPAPGEHRIDLLVSSMSAHGRAVSLGPRVARSLRAAGWQVTARVTTPDDNPTLVAHTCEAPYVAGLGGDGYLSAIAQGTRRSGATFVPLPGGRGNDLCRSLGIGIDPIARAGALEPGAGETRLLDAVEVCERGKEPRMILGIVSFGLDAVANLVANETTWIRSGTLAYAWGALVGLRRHKVGPLVALVDGVEEDIGGWLTSVSNSGWFGGGINLVPDGNPFDGTLELVHVGPLPLSRALPVLGKVLLTRGNDPAMTTRRVREIEIISPGGVIAMADGDHVGTTPLRMRVIPAAVRVLV